VVRDQLDAKIGLLQNRSGSRDGQPLPGPPIRELQLLIALRSLLSFWVPVLFQLGWKVRRCTWEGRPGGTVTGALAKEILEHCLLCLSHLLDDRDSREEYVRTISVALLMWQPWYTSLPGCCFVEESCEALLSRMRGRCDRHRGLTGFAATQDLYQSMPAPSEDVRTLQGGLRALLVQLFVGRIRALIQDPSNRLHAQWRSAGQSVWQPADAVALGIPTPDPLPPTVTTDAVAQTMRGALVCLCGISQQSAPMTAFLDQHITRVSDEEVALRERALAEVRSWTRARAQRGKERLCRQRKAAPLGIPTPA